MDAKAILNVVAVSLDLPHALRAWRACASAGRTRLAVSCSARVWLVGVADASHAHQAHPCEPAPH